MNFSSVFQRLLKDTEDLRPNLLFTNKFIPQSLFLSSWIALFGSWIQVKEKTSSFEGCVYFSFKSSEKQGKGTTCSQDSIFWGLVPWWDVLLSANRHSSAGKREVCLCAPFRIPCLLVCVKISGGRGGCLGFWMRLDLGACSKQRRKHLLSRNEQLDLHEALWERTEWQHLTCPRYLWWDRVLGFYPSGKGTWLF